MTVGERIKLLREGLGLSQEELAKLVGYQSRSSINKIELGLRDITPSKIKKLADVLQTTPSYLMGWQEEGESEPPSFGPLTWKRVPLLKEISGDDPIYIQEDGESCVMVGADLQADFCLQAKDDSMMGARIMSGDIVFIRRQDRVEDGEIAAVAMDGSVTLKRVYYHRESGTVQLVSENPSDPPVVYGKDQQKEIHILGKAVAFQSTVR